MFLGAVQVRFVAWCGCMIDSLSCRGFEFGSVGWVGEGRRQWAGSLGCRRVRRGEEVFFCRGGLIGEGRATCDFLRGELVGGFGGRFWRGSRRVRLGGLRLEKRM